ncbi:MAG: hypothetical protein VX346_25600 [Planctomycetota bacterium]|nr:hypothetical protein [Planctomycetota bacterium]
MQFKSGGQADGGRLTFEINGRPIPAGSVKRTFDADGQNDREGRPCGPFYRCVFNLKPRVAQAGCQPSEGRSAMIRLEETS